MHSTSQTYLISTLLFQAVLSGPIPDSPLTVRGGDSQLPTCFYDQSGVVCNGAPNIAWCDAAVDYICGIFATMDPSNHTNIFISVGDDGSSDSGQNAQCLVSVKHNDGETAVVPKDVCVQKFQTLEGCQAPANNNYNSNCVGGSINVHFNDNKIGTEVDNRYPWYFLSVPKGSSGAGAAVHKPGDLSPGNDGSGQSSGAGGSGGVKPNTSSGTSNNAAGSSNRGGGGTAAGRGAVGTFTG
ncbi:MAG: hypothetical protein OHK93_004312 [Ramalina farinacea]|uniref:Secreted protein n=1 Tax=Ramalina farinacea TaxID=258253 RepID=A0AA43TVV1_9LECA|nr:hypothetical protein [Ramalina farinacea]